MRMGRPGAKPTRPNERGAVAVLMAILLPVFMASAAFAVDLGSAWSERRRLATATDAAALAAAQEYSSGGNGCDTTDDSYVDRNDPDATVTDCTRVGATGAGYVTVAAESTVEFVFAPIFGHDTGDIGASTTAMYGSPLAVEGLRPLAICMSFPEVGEWLNAPDGPTGPSDPITIPFTRDDIGCDEAPGNWGWLDVDGGGGGASELEHDLRYGSDEAVAIPGLLEPKTGRVSSVEDDLSYLASNEMEFPVPLFDYKTGTGDNARYHAVGVATVKLIDYEVGGDQEDDSFTFIFTPKTVQGSCCSGSSINTGTTVVTICSVDEDFDPSACLPT